MPDMGARLTCTCTSPIVIVTRNKSQCVTKKQNFQVYFKWCPNCAEVGDPSAHCQASAVPYCSRNCNKAADCKDECGLCNAGLPPGSLQMNDYLMQGTLPVAKVIMLILSGFWKKMAVSACSWRQGVKTWKNAVHAYLLATAWAVSFWIPALFSI